MTWKRLSREGRVVRHVTDAAELQSLQQLAARGLQDAAVAGVSADGRFVLAYGAALALARMVVARAGWRIRGPGAHATAFEALAAAMGSSAKADADYLESCRLRRNMLVYDAEGLVSEDDAQEILHRVRSLQSRVVAWCVEKR